MCATLEECGVETGDNELDNWPDFDWEIQTSNAEPILWIHTEDNGNIENVAAVAQAFLKKFYPDNTFGFEWAGTESKPLIDAFGGGAVFVTAKTIRFASTHTLLERLKKEVADGD